jgi:hypothetical protein
MHSPKKATSPINQVIIYYIVNCVYSDQDKRGFVLASIGTHFIDFVILAEYFSQIRLFINDKPQRINNKRNTLPR